MTDASRAWATTYRQIDEAPPRLSARRLRAALRSGFLSLAGALARNGEEDVLRCLYLHYVYDDQVAAFRRTLEGLMGIGRFVSGAEAIAIARGEQPVRGRCFHLSIDDGFDNVHRNAFPVLREKEIPATLFVPTAWVGASDREARELWWMRGRVPLPTRPLGWRELREMSDGGIEVGSHTRTHARLSEISHDRERLERELAVSRQEIEQALGRPCRSVSWPFGTEADVDEVALAAIEEAGYEACFSALRGRVVPGRTSLFRIPRHHWEPEWPWAHVRYFALGGRE